MKHNWRATTWATSPTRLQQGMAKLCLQLDNINLTLGRSIAWLALLMSLLVFMIVVARYGFASGSIKVQEAVIYMHAMLFMLCGAYCLQQGMHVRIDIFYAKLSPRRQTLIDLIGIVIFLIPSCLFIFYISLDYVSASWSYLEKSPEPDGLPYTYLLKSLLLLMPISILLQAVTDLCRHYFFLRGWIIYPDKQATTDTTTGV